MLGFAYNQKTTHGAPALVVLTMIKAVSYTHLDVYKRQLYYSALSAQNQEVICNKFVTKILTTCLAERRRIEDKLPVLQVLKAEHVIEGTCPQMCIRDRRHTGRPYRQPLHRTAIHRVP